MRAYPARGRFTRFALLLAVLFATFMLVGPAASAQPIPGMSDCKEEPEPEYPGAGMVGAIDPPRDRPGPENSVYAQQGYAGMVWHTYDLGCFPVTGAKMFAPADTWAGNQLFNIAKVVVGATSALNWTIVEGGLLDRLDNLLVEGSYALFNGVFVAWFGLVSVLVAVIMLWSVLRGRIHLVTTKAMFVVAGLALASTAYIMPIALSNAFDGILVTGVADVRSRILQAVSVDPTYALPDTLHNHVVYTTWLAGEFGSAHNAQATELGRDLAHAQAFTQAEVEAGQTGEQAVEDKKQQFKDVAERAGPTYPFMQGIAGSRTGLGALAIVKATLFASFQLVALAALFLCQFLLRIVIILAPVLGLVAMIRNRTLVELLRGIGTTLYHGLVLTVASAVHLMILVLTSEMGLTVFEQLLIMAMVTVVLFLVTHPIRRFKSMFYATSGVFGVDESSLRDVVRRQHRKSRFSAWRRQTADWWKDEAMPKSDWSAGRPDRSEGEHVDESDPAPSSPRQYRAERMTEPVGALGPASPATARPEGDVGSSDAGQSGTRGARGRAWFTGVRGTGTGAKTGAATGTAAAGAAAGYAASKFGRTQYDDATQQNAQTGEEKQRGVSYPVSPGVGIRRDEPASDKRGDTTHQTQPTGSWHDYDDAAQTGYVDDGTSESGLFDPYENARSKNVDDDETEDERDDGRRHAATEPRTKRDEQLFYHPGMDRHVTEDEWNRERERRRNETPHRHEGDET